MRLLHSILQQQMVCIKVFVLSEWLKSLIVRITETFSYSCDLQDYFSQQNIKIHGIRPEECENALHFIRIFHI